MAGRNFPNLIAAFVDAIPDSAIPVRFRTWAAISAIAGALGRRNWYDFGAFKVYPNLFVVLVAEPGRGKSVSLILPFDQVYCKLGERIGSKKEDWVQEYLDHGLKDPLWLIKDRITPEQFSRDLTKCERPVQDLSTLDKTFYEAPVTLITSEFGTFMDRNATYLQMMMTDLWDSRAEFSYRTKTSGQDYIRGPCVNWVACATPEQFVTNMPNNARSQGLLSRMLIVYWNGAELEKDLYYGCASTVYLDALRDDLAAVAKMSGEFRWANKAIEEEARAWIKSGMPPAPTNVNMREYTERRLAHLIKLVMTISASKRDDHKITKEDWDDAIAFLLEIELDMPTALNKFGISYTGQLTSEAMDFLTSVGGKCKVSEFHRYLNTKVKTPKEADDTIVALSKARLIDTDGVNIKKK